jgi:hypothetical protein
MTIAADTDYARSCFVIMPYGVRDTGTRRVDFDRIYEQIFKPAIRRVQIDGRTMIPLRADKPAESRILILAMMRDLLSSRLAVVEITTENRNVHYELGLRHLAVKSGTVLLKLKTASIPFDLSLVKVTAYADTPPTAASESVGTIASVLRESLRKNAVDSPAYLESVNLAALMGPPDKPTKLGELLADAEMAALGGAPNDAAQLYQEAADLAPNVPLLYERQGLLCLESGDQDLARQAFQHAFALRPFEDEATKIVETIRQGRLTAAGGPSLVISDLFPNLPAFERQLDVKQFLDSPPGSKGNEAGVKGDFGGSGNDPFDESGGGEGGLGGGGFGGGGSGPSGSGSGGGFGGGGLGGL